MKKLFFLPLFLLFSLSLAFLSPTVKAASDYTEEENPAPQPIPLENTYIQSIADGILKRLSLSGLTQAQQIQEIYRYLIENTIFDEPVGLDIWRYRGDPQQTPGYVENRALSPLLFGIGTCEDYASALVVLCQRSGLPAQYVAGLTLSVEGEFVDHAWAAVQIDGEWYHIDPQLEQNVTRQNLLTYRYFLKNDSDMLADHRWGKNLAAYYGNPDNANQRCILENWTPPACTAVFPTPSPELLHPAPAPNRRGIAAALEQEKAAYLRQYGPLPEVELHIQPPPVYLLP